MATFNKIHMRPHTAETPAKRVCLNMTIVENLIKNPLEKGFNPKRFSSFLSEKANLLRSEEGLDYKKMYLPLYLQIFYGLYAIDCDREWFPDNPLTLHLQKKRRNGAGTCGCVRCYAARSDAYPPHTPMAVAGARVDENGGENFPFLQKISSEICF